MRVSPSSSTVHLVISKDKSMGEKRFKLATISTNQAYCNIDANVVPLQPALCSSIEYADWRVRYARYIDHMFEYLSWHLENGDTLSTANAVITLRNPEVLKEAFAVYIYKHSSNKHKIYKFFK